MGFIKKLNFGEKFEFFLLIIQDEAESLKTDLQVRLLCSKNLVYVSEQISKTLLLDFSFNNFCAT